MLSLWATALGAQQAAGEITVYAAASLTDAFQELAALEEFGPGGTRVRLNFAGSQQLAMQLAQGARADVFAAADQRWMTYLAERGLIAGGAEVFACNRLVAIVPRSNPARIGRLEDLALAGVKLVVGAEAVPVGRYTREVVRRLAGRPDFPPGYGDRVLANVVSQEENVRSVVAKVRLGEADAGIVYRSDVTGRVAASVRLLEIPRESNVDACYPVAVLAESGEPAAARSFVTLLLGPRGREVLAKHGLEPVGPGR